MNTQLKSCQVLMFFLGTVWLVPFLSALDLSAREANDMINCSSAGAAPTTASAAIPRSQLSAKAVAGYQGDGLAITPTPEGARLKCVFQRLEAEATPQGLWLTSTVTNQAGDRFRVKAVTVGRRASVEREAWSVGASERGALGSESVLPTLFASCSDTHTLQRSNAQRFDATRLSDTGTVQAEGQAVRFIRPGLVEEYTVSMDGVRQDFVVTEKPAGAGALQVGLAVAGARVEAMPGFRPDGEASAPQAGGARLVLEPSGRRIAYTRMRATDATGRELPARIEVMTSNSESRKHKAEMSQSAATEQNEAAMEAIMVVVVEDAGAVYPVRIDPTFSDANWISLGGIPGADGYVYAAVVDSAGNLYIGGDFKVAGETAANNIARWDGSAWSALGSGMNDYVNALAVSGSDLYAAGGFTVAGGKVSGYVAKAIAVAGDWLRIRNDVPGPHTNTLDYVGVPNAQYLVQFATNLTTSPWFTLATNTAAPNGRGTLLDCTATDGQRFYRISAP